MKLDSFYIREILIVLNIVDKEKINRKRNKINQ